jgi:hypothetical protein
MKLKTHKNIAIPKLQKLSIILLNKYILFS